MPEHATTASMATHAIDSTPPTTTITAKDAPAFLVHGVCSPGLPDREPLQETLVIGVANVESRNWFLCRVSDEILAIDPPMRVPAGRWRTIAAHGAGGAHGTAVLRGRYDENENYVIATAARQRPMNRSSRAVSRVRPWFPSFGTLCRNDTTDGRGKSHTTK